MEKNIIDKVVKHYLESGHFNGISVRYFVKDAEHSAIKKLIDERKIDLLREDDDVNCHIKRLGVMPVKVQLKKIESDGFSGCLYPTPELLKELKAGVGKKSPYTRELMRGVPQLSFRAFDIRMVEWYRNDPRFKYKTDDIHCQIFQKADTKVKGLKIRKDDFEFFRFGFAYNSEKNRAIVAFIWDLYKLPYELQIEMKKHELEGDYKLHKGFYETSIRGDFSSVISACSAFLMQKTEINKICKIIGKPLLFKTDHSVDDGLPDGFSILIRPTKREFGNFALLLDQFLGDDINSKFFAGDVDLHIHLKDKDDNPVKQSKGTIQLLEEWVNCKFNPRNPEVFKEFFKDFRAIRKTRQGPAHRAENNDFNEEYIIKQSELIEKALNVITGLRSILQQHPKAQDYKIPVYLEKSEIWFM